MERTGSEYAAGWLVLEYLRRIAVHSEPGVCDCFPRAMRASAYSLLLYCAKFQAENAHNAFAMS